MKLLVGVVAVALAMFAAPARADSVDDLTKQLASSNEKTRVSATVSLARLGDKRSLKPLVTALHDPSAEVRTIAAVALGKLKHKAALPSLRAAATDDTDDIVRKKAREAALAVAKANDLDAELPNAEPVVATKAQARHKGFGHSPHAVADAPDLYVMIKSSSDDSPGKADKPTRKQNAEVVKQVLLDSFKSAPQVTLTASDAQRWGLDPRTIDLSVVKMDVETNGGYVEIAAELRLAISDDKGKMLSFLSGGAKVQIPSAKFKGQYLPNYRREALEGAMHGMFDKLLAHLRQQSQS
ncbi:MAG TPA: HEAT repeat domain-containing protein [Kofleriaceae bacterium]|nr:HEAT repeat domain-containing protein [Kofleriaceae bacterium]